MPLPTGGSPPFPEEWRIPTATARPLHLGEVRRILLPSPSFHPRIRESGPVHRSTGTPPGNDTAGNACTDPRGVHTLRRTGVPAVDEGATSAPAALVDRPAATPHAPTRLPVHPRMSRNIWDVSSDHDPRRDRRPHPPPRRPDNRPARLPGIHAPSRAPRRYPPRVRVHPGPSRVCSTG